MPENCARVSAYKPVSKSGRLVKFSSGYFTIQSGGEFAHQPFFTCPTSPFVIANALPVFCPFQLRSVTDEQHVRNHAEKELEGSSLWVDTRQRCFRAVNIKKLLFNSRPIYILDSDGQGIWTPECPCDPTTVPF